MRSDPPSMSDDELIAWARGYVAGWSSSDELAELDGRQAPARTWSLRDLERAGRRRLWDQMVLRGEFPDLEEIERNLWIQPRS